MSQENSFSSEINNIKLNKSVNKNSKLCNFNVMIDYDYILRIKSRLTNSSLDVYEKHPIILSNDYFASLIVYDCHEQVLHNGVKETLIQNDEFRPESKERLCTTPYVDSPPTGAYAIQLAPSVGSMSAMWQNATLGTSLPYITIFAKNRVGISATALAAILTTQQFLFIFTKPLIGYIADYFNKLKVIIGILAVIQTIFFFLLLTIPKIQKEQKTEIIHNETDLKSVFGHFNSTELLVKCDFRQQNDIFSEKDTSSYNNSQNNDICFLPFDILSEFSDLCSNYTTERNKSLSLDSSNVKGRSSTETSPINFGQQINYASISKPLCTICCKVTGDCQDIQCEAQKNDSNRVSIEQADISDFKTYQFWLFAFLTTFGMMSANAMFTLSDTACCESVQKFGTDFGRQRLWGAIGWGLMSPVGGLINDYTDDYAASWTLMAIMSVVALFNIRRLDLVKPQFSQNILKDVGLVLSSGEFLAFKTGVLMNGIGTGVTWFYLIWFLTTIGGSRFLCGMVQFVQCFVGEIPFMFYSGWMLKKIGHFNVLTLALMSYCIRFFWYSQLYNPWLVLPTECLHGFTYGLFYVAVASYAKLSAKPGTEATTQAVLFTSHEGLGAGLGCVLAGIGFDTFGGHKTFLFASIFAGSGMVLSIVLHLCVRKQKGAINVSLPAQA
ncbi:major facilitator superfamily domain-containing protein 6 [Trichonephila clavata]|uniref:Major facilitator superfamily domain-containing protein 6 n=1 Tax=Trichonephila clavata TaxID=2740835 RepID=A0A8X6EXZ9_TRICU|nr:major facilitator superfamily domain-containing protein 6 [Trichonephila clavata]